MITVYTALFGDVTRDRLRPPPEGCDARYVCFTDAPLSVHGWTVERVSTVNRSPCFLARLFKARPDRWFGVKATTIWVDASCEPLVPAIRVLEQAVLAHGSIAPVVALGHPDRNTVEAEAREVTRLDLAPADIVARQLADYQAAGFAIDRGPLTTTGFLLRLPNAQAFNECWETQIIRYNLRDQLSVDFSAWRTGTPIAHLPGSYRDNAVMHYHRHARLAS